MWDLPGPGLEPVSPELAGGFLTTAPPGKPARSFLTHLLMKIKTKIKKWDLMKLKNFCSGKEIINKTKRQPSEREKIFANEATDKRLISKIYKRLMQLNIKKKKTQSKNGQKT